MKIRLGLAVLLAILCGSHVMAQQGRSFFPQSASSTAARVEDSESEDTVVQAPQTATIGSPKGTKAPGGDYGLGQPLCAPQISLSPKSNCTKGQHWWCDPCGFGGWGCGTPVRTFARNMKTQVSSLIPCGPWCRNNGCNCSGQGPYAMDWSQPDRRSCPCDCKGSHYLFPWIWNYNPSRKGCCINRWTQRGDGYRSALQFEKTPSPEMPYEDQEATPVAPPATVEATKTAKGKVYKVSHETVGKQIASRQPASAVIRDVAPTQEEEAAEDTGAVRKAAPTGAMSANYLARLLPKSNDEVETRVATPAKSGTSRRR